MFLGLDGMLCVGPWSIRACRPGGHVSREHKGMEGMAMRDDLLGYN